MIEPKKWTWAWLYAQARPAFDELGVYVVTLVGVVISPIIVSAQLDVKPELELHWWFLAISLFVSWAVIALFEMKGTKDEKKIKSVLFRRYTLGFFSGVAWRVVIPAVLGIVVKLFDNLKGLVE